MLLKIKLEEIDKNAMPEKDLLLYIGKLVWFITILNNIYFKIIKITNTKV